MSSTIQKPEVKKSEFIKLASTHTKAFVADYYGLSEKDITKLAGQCKVSFKKRKEDNFTLVDDLDEVNISKEVREPYKSHDSDGVVDALLNGDIQQAANITNTTIEVDKPF